MAKIRETLEKIANKFLVHPVRNIGLAGLIALSAVTTLKDNVHFGSVSIHNPKESQYVWGIIPLAKIHGEANGSIYNFGILSKNEFAGYSAIKGNSFCIGLGSLTESNQNTKINGSIYTIGFVAFNNLGNTSEVNGNINAESLLCGSNSIAENSQITGNMDASGIIAGQNLPDKHSEIIGNMRARAVLIAKNQIGLESEITGDMYARALFFGANDICRGSTMTGNIDNKAIFAHGPYDLSLGSNTHIGLDEKISKKEVKMNNSLEASEIKSQ